MTWSEKDIECLNSLIADNEFILEELVERQKELSERFHRYRVVLACLEHCREEVVSPSFAKDS